MGDFSSSDYLDLQNAVTRLETESFGMMIASKVGMPVEAFLHMLPKGAQMPVGAAVNKALEQCLRIAINAGKHNSALGRNNKHRHTAAVAISGAVGGFFGLPGLFVELPITTTVMLHSIVEIACSQGEDLSNPDSSLACLEVLALGAEGIHKEALESAYYATRTALAQFTREAAAHVAQRGLTKEGAPALVSFLGKVASRFGIEVSEKAAAELVPIAGAVGGLTLNVLFIRYFQRLAEGHFTVRRLERMYGPDVVRREYAQARLLRRP